MLVWFVIVYQSASSVILLYFKKKKLFHEKLWELCMCGVFSFLSEVVLVTSNAWSLGPWVPFLNFQAVSILLHWWVTCNGVNIKRFQPPVLLRSLVTCNDANLFFMLLSVSEIKYLSSFPPLLLLLIGRSFSPVKVYCVKNQLFISLYLFASHFVLF